MGAVPRNLASALNETSPELFPNIFIFYLLNILAVLPVTSCEAERCISSLCRLKDILKEYNGTGPFNWPCTYARPSGYSNQHQ